MSDGMLGASDGALSATGYFSEAEAEGLTSWVADGFCLKEAVWIVSAMCRFKFGSDILDSWIVVDGRNRMLLVSIEVKFHKVHDSLTHWLVSFVPLRKLSNTNKHPAFLLSFLPRSLSLFFYALVKPLFYQFLLPLEITQWLQLRVIRCFAWRIPSWVRGTFFDFNFKS